MYLQYNEQAVMGREDSGNADVVNKYRSQVVVSSIRLYLDLGCSIRDNLPADQCPDCQQVPGMVYAGAGR